MYVKNLLFPGQQRSKLLSTLYKDERCQQLPAFNILEKMYHFEYCVWGGGGGCVIEQSIECTLNFCRYLERIIRLSELEEFSALLASHQKATTADGKVVSTH